MSFAAAGVMPSAIRDFAAQFPDVALELRYLRTQAQKLAISRGDIDAGFMLDRAGAIDGSRRERLSNWSKAMRSRGMLEADDDRWRLSAAGLRLTNQAILEAAEAIDPS
jgi:hypothetical protein